MYRVKGTIITYHFRLTYACMYSECQKSWSTHVCTVAFKSPDIPTPWNHNITPVVVVMARRTSWRDHVCECVEMERNTGIDFNNIRKNTSHGKDTNTLKETLICNVIVTLWTADVTQVKSCCKWIISCAGKDETNRRGRVRGVSKADSIQTKYVSTGRGRTQGFGGYGVMKGSQVWHLSQPPSLTTQMSPQLCTFHSFFFLCHSWKLSIIAFKYA